MATTSHCCDVQHRVVTLLHCSTIASVPTACQWRHVVAAADYSAAECDDCRSQRPTRYLHCLTPSVEATSRRWMRTTLDQWSPLHSPTHRDYHWHRLQCKELVADRAVKYCAHIGGGYYISVNSGFYCVNFRKFFMPCNEKEVKPMHKGIALRLNQWARMKTIVETINSTYPSLGTAIPCYYQDDHNNQVGMFRVQPVLLWRRWRSLQTCRCLTIKYDMNYVFTSQHLLVTNNK